MRLVLAVTGATGARAAYLLARRSAWPVALVASEWGRKVYERECGPFGELEKLAEAVYDNRDLAAGIRCRRHGLEMLAQGVIPHVALQAADGNRLTLLTDDTHRLALRFLRADAAADGR